MAQIKKSFYEDQFFGMNLRLDADKVPDGFSPMAVNVDLTRMKTLRKRQGSALLGQAFADKQTIQSIIELTNPNGSKQAFMVRGGSVYIYDYFSSSWAIAHSGAFTPEVSVASVTYKNKVYMTSQYDFLQATDGVNISDIGSETNRIKGKCLAVGQRTLFVGNVEVNGVSYPDRVYYSRFDIDNRTEGDEFWEAIESGNPGTLTTSTRFFRVEGGNVRAIASFANRDRVYIFSDTKCYAFNVDQAEDNPFGALYEIFPIGCVGSNAVTVVAGVMYWMDNNGKIYAWTGGTTRPEEISYNIDDEGLGASIVSSIDKTEENLTQVAAFGIWKQIYFSVGSIQVGDRSIKNACIKMFLSQNGLLSYASIDTFPERPLVGGVLRINNENKLTVGNSCNILTLKTGLNDTNGSNLEVAIDSFYRTKSYNFGYALHKKMINNIFVQYKPQPQDAYLEILTRVSNSTEYIPIISPDTPDKYGTINMRMTKSQQRQINKKVNMPIETEGESISFEFANRQKDQTFEIYGFGSLEVNISPINVSIE